MATYNFPPIKFGNTFKGRNFTVTSNLNRTLVDVCFQIKANPNAAVAHQMQTTVVDAENFTVPDWNVDIKPREYVYDVKLTFSDGFIVSNWLEGRFTVLQNVSNCG